MCSSTFFDLGCQCCKNVWAMNLCGDISGLPWKVESGFKNTRWIDSSNQGSGEQWRILSISAKGVKMNFYCKPILSTNRYRQLLWRVTQYHNHCHAANCMAHGNHSLRLYKQLTYRPNFFYFFCSRTKRRARAKRWDTSVMLHEFSYKKFTITFCRVFGCKAIYRFVGYSLKYSSG